MEKKNVLNFITTWVKMSLLGVEGKQNIVEVCRGYGTVLELCKRGESADTMNYYLESEGGFLSSVYYFFSDLCIWLCTIKDLAFQTVPRKILMEDQTNI